MNTFMNIFNIQHFLLIFFTLYCQVYLFTKFTYLGATITPEGGGMGDLKNRINRARNTFTKLGKIWNNNKITRKTKIKLFKTLVTPVLLYGCET